MTDKFQRVIPIDDAQLRQWVEEKGALVEKGRGFAREMEELAKQHERALEAMTELTTKITALKRNIFRRVEKKTKDLLTEFEIPVTTEIRDGQLVLLATDALAEFQDTFKRFDKWHEPVPRREKKLEDNS
ncbi:hypothetical protein UNPF46_08585 [Bradyrhizobium sp. UNPF46]|uniref:hypothetical protein n=1 Tax=Bradyrhizobium sp. UNPF46 TaxID=1141168 RepID=UPI00114FB731|nr:hypothetical protein [Bradyrhizobium sp. UNPF46]TQF41167.1 hypothetical protein UNPF46_08585 [Bradyrhizobium sp. UNPF46]